jgi:predicted nucleic acid-binding protein
VKRYLLDSPIIAAHIIGRESARDLIAPWLVEHEVVTSIVVYGEVYEYIRSFRDFDERYLALQTFIQECNIAGVSVEIMETYANLRRSMRRPYGDGLIGDIDTLIAATCLRHGLTVVSTDGHFRRVPRLNSIIVNLETLGRVHD